MPEMGAPTKPTKPAKRAPRKATGPAVKAAPAKATVPSDVFDLDSLTKAEALPELELPDKPFGFRLDGHDYELTDPRDNDWTESWRLASNPYRLMHVCLVGADEPITDPTEKEIIHAQERVRLSSGEDEDEQDGATEERDGEANADEATEEPQVVPLLIDRFTAAPMSGWKMNALSANWGKYFKFDPTDGQGILAMLLGHSAPGE